MTAKRIFVCFAQAAALAAMLLSADPLRADEPLVPAPAGLAKSLGLQPLSMSAWIARAEGGDPVAQDLLGDWLFFGEHGLEQDKAAAAEWYLRAAEAGYMGAMGALSGLYKTGQGLPVDRLESRKWLALSDYQDLTQFRRSLGLSLANKWEQDSAEILRRIVAWLAAREDFQLIELADLSRAPVDVWRARAEFGNREAQYKLALWYYDGERGLEADRATAARWFRRAANNGHRKAQFRMAEMYKAGDGVEADPFEHAKWTRIAEPDRNLRRFWHEFRQRHGLDGQLRAQNRVERWKTRHNRLIEYENEETFRLFQGEMCRQAPDTCRYIESWWRSMIRRHLTFFD